MAFQSELCGREQLVLLPVKFRLEELLCLHYLRCGSIGPGVIGVVTQNANDNLKAGMLAACVFPVVLILSVLFIRKKRAEIKPINQKTESFL